MSAYTNAYSLMTDSHSTSNLHKLYYLYKKNLLYEIAKDASRCICVVNLKQRGSKFSVYRKNVVYSSTLSYLDAAE